MAGNLDHVFRRVGAGRLEVVITTRSSRFPSSSGSSASDAPQPRHRCPGEAEGLFGNLAGRRSGKTHHAQAAAAQRSRNGRDGIGCVQNRFRSARRDRLESGWLPAGMAARIIAMALARTTGPNSSRIGNTPSAARAARLRPRAGTVLSLLLVIGNAGHSSWIDHHLALWSYPGALTPNARLVSQRQVNHPALTAVHGVKPEWTPVRFTFSAAVPRSGAIFDPQQPVIIDPEGYSGVMFRRHPEHLLGQVLERQQHFGFIGQQQVHIRTRNFTIISGV